MARLPRYQSSGVRARQPQSIDFAGYRESARASSQFSKSLDQMSGFLYKKAEQQAVRSGLERVRSEGAQPLLEEMQAQGGPRGLEETTAYDAANRIAVAEIQSEAELEITRIFDDGQKNNQSYSAIQAQLQDVRDGFPAALSDIDPVSAGTLRVRLSEATQKAEMRYANWYTKKQQAAAAKRRNVAAGNKGETIVKNAITPGYTLEEIQNDVAKGAEDLRDMGASDENVQAWSESVIKEAARENFIFNFYQQPIDQQKQTMERVLSGEETLPGLDFEDSIRLVNGTLRPEYNRSLSVVTAQSEFVVDKTEEASEVLESGGVLTQETLSGLQAQASEIAEYDNGASVAAVRSLEADNEFFSQLRVSSYSEVEGIVNDLADGADGTLDTAQEVKRYEQAQKFFSNMKTQINADPMGYAERTGFIERRPILGLDEQGRPVIDQDALQERALQSRQVSNHLGLSAPKVLFADEARQLSLALEKADGAAKLDILATLASFDASVGQVLTDVAEYTPGMSLVGGLVASDNQQAAYLAVAGMDRLKTGEKPIEFTPTNIDPVFRDVFERAVTTPEHTKAIKNVAKAIYTEMAAQQGLDEFDKDVYTEALQMAAGQKTVGREVYGGIQDVRSVPTYINPSMTAGSMETILDNFNAQSVEDLTGQVIEPRLANDIRTNENYKLKNIGGDKYVIEHSDLANAVVQDVRGVPITFTSKQMLQILATPEQPSLDVPSGLQAPTVPEAEFSGQAMSAVQVPPTPGAMRTDTLDAPPSYREGEDAEIDRFISSVPSDVMLNNTEQFSEYVDYLFNQRDLGKPLISFSKFSKKAAK